MGIKQILKQAQEQYIKRQAELEERLPILIRDAVRAELPNAIKTYFAEMGKNTPKESKQKP